jgi:hypothetical protein
VSKILSDEQISLFNTNGFLVLKGFYDIENQIDPILSAIYEIIGICLEKHSIEIERMPFSREYFDHGYQALIKKDRSIGGVIYDAVKQIPAFQRLVSCQKHENLVKQLRKTKLAGIASGGSGIRIDNPAEKQYQAPWHQEFPAQLRSLDGLIFWSPLRNLTSQLGPVEICPQSQHEGIIPVYSDSDESGKTGAYALRLENEEQVITKYQSTTPLADQGDLVLMDWLVVHRSGTNNSAESRWTMQIRYFNFMDKIGISTDWKGSFASGVDFRDVFPELILASKERP